MTEAQRIYLNQAAGTRPLPPSVREAFLVGLDICDSHRAGMSDLSALRILEQTRSKVADLLGCSDNRVCFTHSATIALNTLIKGIVLPKGKKHIVRSVTEHNSVLRPLRSRAEAEGLELVFVEPREDGFLYEEDLCAKIDEHCACVVLNHASNVTGALCPLMALSLRARYYGVPVIVDASQSAGAYPINMRDLGISALCFESHKSLLAAPGAGGLCLADGIEVEPLIEGGTGIQSFAERQPRDYPTRLEAGTPSLPAICALGAALDLIEKLKPAHINRQLNQRCQTLYKELSELSCLQAYAADYSRAHVGILAFNLADIPSTELSEILFQDFGIETRPGIHCAPLMHRWLATTAQGCVRVSISPFTTSYELEQLAHAVKKIACDLGLE